MILRLVEVSAGVVVPQIGITNTGLLANDELAVAMWENLTASTTGIRKVGLAALKDGDDKAANGTPLKP